jgi:hypothetical protein
MTIFNIESITLPAALTVSKRDGSSVDVDVTRVHPSLFADFVTEGLAEYIRDASASALLTAYNAAHPKATEEELKATTPDTRKAWGQANPALVAAVSNTLMQDAVQAVYEGTRSARSTTASAAFTAFEDALYKLADSIKTGAQWGDIATTFAAAKGLATGERKAAVLATIAAMPDARKAKLHDAAQSSLDALAMLA